MVIDERFKKLEQELTAVRRQNRLLLMGFVICLGLIAFSALGRGRQAVAAEVSGVQFKAVKARKFILEDEKGEIRGILAVDKGEPMLILYDTNGQTTAVLAATSKGPDLTLYDDRNPRLSLTVGAKHQPHLTMYTANGTPGVILGLLKESPTLIMCNSKGVPLWHAP